MGVEQLIKLLDMFIGIDLGGTKTEVILINENGNEIERFREKTPKN